MLIVTCICCRFQQVWVIHAHFFLTIHSSVFRFDGLMAWTLVFSLPNKNQDRALCRPVRIVRFSLLEVILHQEQHIFWVVVLEDKAMTQTQFCCWHLAVFVQNLLIILLSSFTSALMRFTVPDALKHLQNIILPPPFFTLGTVFFVLYASACFLQELHCHLIWPKDVHPEWITIFQVLLCRV